MTTPRQEPIDRLIGQARSRTLHLLRQAADHYRIPTPRTEIRFDLCGKAAGQVRFPRRGRPLIRYNRQLLLENGERFLDRTLPHEVAHVVANRLFGPHIRPHGAEWQAVMQLFGADSSRCHDYDTSRSNTRRLTRHPYRCGCREHALTSIRHNRILAGQVYYCRTCGEALVAVL
jgi:SprT protein